MYRIRHPRTRGPLYEASSCGIGWLASTDGAASRRTVALALEAAACLDHRGAKGADGKTADGGGVLTDIPRKLLAKCVPEMRTVAEQDWGVGVFFLPLEQHEQSLARLLIEGLLDRNGIAVAAWRPVPIAPEALGRNARETMPAIRQLFVRRPPGISASNWELRLYLVRKEIERRAAEEGLDPVYPVSFSSRTIVYKGMVSIAGISDFFRDLQDGDYESRCVMFHQRFSTNTWPDWLRAQPFRLTAHNGEINTLQGNVNWARARQHELPQEAAPVIQEWGSDSTKLDNVLEATIQAGYDPYEAMLTMIPDAHEKSHTIPDSLKAFYDHASALTEPWDGPAALIYYDGRQAIAHLDRNGLRPVRYLRTDEFTLVCSEAGVLEIPGDKVVERGQLGAGEIAGVDTETGEWFSDSSVKDRIARMRDWGPILRARVREAGRSHTNPREWSEASLLPYQIASGMSHEDIQRIFSAMFEGKEPVGSMGDDTPITVLSERPRTLYWYFRQLFAQVTNPPIDSLREGIVFSLTTYAGDRSGWWSGEQNGDLVKLRSPILLEEQFEWLAGQPGAQRIQTLFSPSADALAGAVTDIADKAEQAARAGCGTVVLTDRGADRDHAAVPMLLAVSAVHHRLLEKGLRMKAGIVADTSSVWQDHHLACLLGYGANAAHPWLALATTAASGHDRTLYVRALEKGLYKVMAKMGVSPVTSYIGAQLFEALGLDQDVLDRYFPGTHCSLSGCSLKDIAEEALSFHVEAFGEPATRLPDRGEYRHRQQGQHHRYSPDVVRLLQDSVGLVRGAKQFHQTKPGGQESYDRFADLWREKPPAAIRDLLEFAAAGPGVPLDEVEPAEAIVRRFCGAAMSHGALSLEAHETIAIGLNRIGAKSNSGEGGEDAARFGSESRSRIKQVASARFGVTPAYLVDASELQIKMAQGSKPGEGGQIPGLKVTDYIARLRHAQPGIDLISPPPMHDIYSIEDLAQLIYDLKVINAGARINVKLVAELGVGTIAAGVAKAGADIIHISGHSGGTGASPWGSIKHAGIPWEIGIWETHRVLTLNGLRNRVSLVTDGGFQTGRDVVAAALLGADEYAFGTALLVAISCVMARQCHLNTCPVGITSQDPAFRAKYPGQPEHIVRYLMMVAEEVRALLAEMGARNLDEIIGRTDLLKTRNDLSERAARLDLRDILAEPLPLGPKSAQPPAEAPLDERIITEGREAIEGRGSVRLKMRVRNTDRAVGARAAGEIARRYGDAGLPDGAHLVADLEGSAGQSLGFACIDGLQINVLGEANDYVGKSMCGGIIAIRPPEGAAADGSRNSIIGNVALYGATGGKLFAAGRAGQRFAVRNSGASAVVEGATKHCCEYMTGGTVVILGPVTDNFGAGMTGGRAFLTEITPEQINEEYVRIVEPAEDDLEEVRLLVSQHLELTGSAGAAEIIGDWDIWKARFHMVSPRATAVVAEQHMEEISQPSVR